MSHSDDGPTGRLRIADVASLLGVTVDSLPGDKRQIGALVELTEGLMERNGEEWIRQHGGVILDQWETMLTLGI
ncbi:MAG TPA: hypothetical protein VLX12_04210 [Syntrophorhabdales bacterium]|nr:hypothetical protein [Syntrophorhabdales bacterium]